MNMNFSESFGMHTASKTDGRFLVTDDRVRISVLTPRLVRVEVSDTNRFMDDATQKVWYRSFDEPEFEVSKEKNKLVITTSACRFAYDFSARRMISVTVDGREVTDFSKGNLKGTRRTLDQTVGPAPLEDGVVSRNGVAVLDDSDSLVLCGDGKILPRPFREKDCYYFAYGHDYRACIRDFFRLTGPVPLVPRFCLGNWWSRYKAYTQNEYMELMNRFLEEKIPVTVATIDMDWHWVNVIDRFGNDAKLEGKPLRFWTPGWTGYSWNTDLFPDYKALLKWLHEKNFKVTLNVHPADGVRCFEDMYEETAAHMGIDPKTKKPVPFDITDPKFVEAYFQLVHHPYEMDGVDFWWIDWQQGKKTAVEGLDPLWALNHYHYLDSERENRRGLILSRYAGAGSHRYPLGFSGDTMITWRCYRFQPYFTATAANIGYTWWSHDIGGHHQGRKDDELYIRWLQMGVFSPINRLHSTSQEFMGKEPWKCRWDVEQLAVRYLRLRHRMIPYLYAMNYRTHKFGQAMIEPMYYEYPEEEQAYRVPNQYLFGPGLIAAPITEKLDAHTNLAGVSVWLPEGRYTDVFTSRIYSGGRTVKMFRGIESFPLLAREGTILPLDRNDTENDCTNPAELELLIFRGQGSFDLYEDDGESRAFEKGIFAVTRFEVEESGASLRFTIEPAQGDGSASCASRTYLLSFRDIVRAKEITVLKNGEPLAFECSGRHTVSVSLAGISPFDRIEVLLKGTVPLENPPKEKLIVDLVSKFQCSVAYKGVKFNKLLADPAANVWCRRCYSEPIAEINALLKS